MDAVITYVNGLDPLWQKDYENTVGKQVIAKRFRDWGTLKYLLRGIEVNMPFIRNVYLVVARESQVPEWVNREKLHVVLHSDIIPSQYIPVFNSTAIEMFLYRIPGLDEQFIYFNDDFFPMKPCRPEDFFVDGKAAVRFSSRILACTQYYKHTKISDRFAARYAGKNCGLSFIRPQHICTPLLKSSCEELFAKAGEEIESTVTRVRVDENLNYYVFSDYMYYKGLTVPGKVSKKHFSLAVASCDTLCSFIAKPYAQMMCVNDVQLPDERFVMIQGRWLEAFEKAFPVKSEYEL